MADTNSSEEPRSQIVAVKKILKEERSDTRERIEHFIADSLESETVRKDRVRRNSCLESIRLASNVFPKIVAGVLLRKIQGIFSGPKENLFFLKCCVAVTRQYLQRVKTDDDKVLPVWHSQLVATQISLLRGTFCDDDRSSKRVFQSACRCFLNAMRPLNAVTCDRAYLKIIKSLPCVEDVSFGCHIMTLHFVSPSTSPYDEKTRSKYRKNLLDVFAKVSFKTSRVSRHFDSWTSVLQLTTRDEFIEHVYPGIKKNMENASQYASRIRSVASSLRFDTSRIVLDFLPGILKCLMSPSCDIQSDGVVALCALLNRCSDIDVVAKVVANVKKSGEAIFAAAVAQVSNAARKSAPGAVAEESRKKKTTEKKNKSAKTKTLASSNKGGKKKKGGGFGFGKKKKTTKSIETTKMKNVGKSVATATKESSAPSDVAQLKDDIRLPALAHVEALRAAIPALIKYGAASKEVVATLAVGVTTYLSKFGAAAKSVPTLLPTAGSFARVGRSLGPSMVATLSAMLASSNRHDVAEAANACAVSFESAHVCRSDGRKLLPVLVGVFEALNDPKKKFEVGDVCGFVSIKSCALALLRLAAADSDCETEIRKIPPSRGLWSSLSAMVGAKSRIFANASPLLKCRNLAELNVERMRSLRSQSGSCDNISVLLSESSDDLAKRFQRSRESYALAGLMETSARKYSSDFRESLFGEKKVEEEGSKAKMGRDCETDTGLFLRTAIMLLLDSDRYARTTIASSLQRIYRSIGDVDADVLCGRLLSSYRQFVEELCVAESVVRKEDRLRFSASMQNRLKMGDLSQYEDEEIDFDVEVWPKRGVLTQALRDIIPPKPSTDRLASLLFLAHHPRVSLERETRHSNPPRGGRGHASLKSPRSRKRTSCSIRFLQEAFGGSEMFAAALRSKQVSRDLATKVSEHLGTSGDRVLSGRRVLEDVAKVPELRSIVESVADETICRVEKLSGEIGSLPSANVRLYADLHIREMEILEIEKLVDVEGRPNKGVQSKTQYKHRDVAWRARVQAVIDEAPMKPPTPEKNSREDPKKMKSRAASYARKRKQHEASVHELVRDLRSRHANAVAQVDSVVAPLRDALLTLRVVVRTSPNTAISMIPQLVPLLRILVQRPIVRSDVLDLVASLAVTTQSTSSPATFVEAFLTSCVILATESAIESGEEELVDSETKATTGENNEEGDDESFGMTPKESNLAVARLVKLMTSLKARCRPVGKTAVTLDASTLHLWFPLIESSLRCVYDDDGSYVVHPAASTALSILAVHAVMSIKAPLAMRALLRPMLESALRFVHRSNGMNISPSPTRVLVALCAGPTPTVSEAETLLGSRMGLLSTGVKEIRLAILSSLAMIVRKAPKGSAGCNALLQSGSLVPALWATRFEDDAKNVKLGTALWGMFGATMSPRVLWDIVPSLSHRDDALRTMAAKAVAAAAKQIPTEVVRLCGRLVQLYDTSLRERRDLIAGPKSPGIVVLLGESDANATSTSSKVKENSLLQSYEALASSREEEMDRKAIVVANANESTWCPRDGVAKAFRACADAGVSALSSQIPIVLPFIVNRCLFDPHTGVQKMFVEAGCSLVNAYGAANMDSMMPILERAFEQGDTTDAEDEAKAKDRQFVGVILMLSLLATHLPKKDSGKTQKILRVLIAALSAPSRAVQEAVAKHLPSLVSKVPGEGQAIVDTLMDQLFKVEPATYGYRRGGAYGLAGVVKGLRVSSLKKYSILDRLVAVIEDTKGPWEAREGALMALEVMFSVLGMIFEPYAIANLPLLLQAFSDRKRDVQLAARDASKAMMTQLTTHGVKQVLPRLIPALKERQWRTKTASINMLGSMAYCAPKHLSAFLPQLVPLVIEAHGSTHSRVQEAAKDALQDIGKVIRNPEIQALVPTLIEALTEPVDCTVPALEALSQTAFVHSIDAPSLALIVPIIQRALRDRKGATKKRAALIFGSIGKLIGSPADVEPYLPTLMPMLRKVIVDPIPDVRAVAGRALGSLYESLGEEYFPDIFKWLLETLFRDEGDSSVERRGAAQALASVMGKMESEAMLAILNDDLLPAAKDSKSHVREGVQWVLVFLPTTFGSKFAQCLSKVLPIIVSGLCDESEPVRETSLQAGRVIVEQHADSEAGRILPVLENGLFLPDHRMRQSSVRLLGDLLYEIGDTKAVHTDDDDTHGTEKATIKIAAKIGSDRLASVLAALYIVRSDDSISVRHSAKLVWKSIVVNTPRTLRESLSAIIERVLELMSSPSEHLIGMAGRCLGDIVSKLGERVLPEVLPILADSFDCEDPTTRRAVCLGIREVVAATHNKAVEEHIDLVLKLVLSSICDPDSVVRSAAAEAFNTLQKRLGQQVVHQVIPSILSQLNCGDGAKRAVALDGLRGILSLRGQAIMPLLVPKLVGDGTVPLTVVQVEAIEAAATVPESKDWMPAFLKDLVPALLAQIRVTSDGGKEGSTKIGAEDAENIAGEELVRSAAEACIVAVDERNLRRLTDVLASAFRDKSALVRSEGLKLASSFFRGTEADFEELVPHFLREILSLYVDSNAAVLAAALGALGALEARIGKEALAGHVDFIRQSLSNTISALKHRKSAGMSLLRDENGNALLPGACQKNGLKPFLAMVQHALHRGPQRQEAAKLYGDLVRLTDKVHLKPYLIKITGPLIRGFGDRFQSKTKVSILDALCLVLDKGGVRLKPFYPQLHATFVKGLRSESEQLRKSASNALDKLVLVTTRVDPLVKDLCGHITSAFDEEDDDTMDDIRACLLVALSSVLEKVGQKVKASVLQLAISVLSPLRGETENIDSRVAIAEGLARCSIYISSEDDFDDYVREIVTRVRDDRSESDWNVRHAHALEVASLAAFATKRLSSDSGYMVRDAFLITLEDENVLVQSAGAKGLLAFSDVLRASTDAEKVKKAIGDALDATTNSSLRRLCSGVLSALEDGA